MRAILIHPNRLEPGDFYFEKSVLVYKVITPKELKRFSKSFTHIVTVDIEFWGRERFKRVNSLIVEKCVGSHQKNESRTAANHINKMRDISFCNRSDCTRRKTCERYLPKSEYKGPFTYVLVEDAVNCPFYFPKFIPEFAGCKLENCQKRKTCARYQDTNYYINNSGWTNRDAENCPYYERKDNV